MVGRQYEYVVLDESAVMPNHVHGLIMIVGATHASPLQPIHNTVQQPKRIPPGGVKWQFDRENPSVRSPNQEAARW